MVTATKLFGKDEKEAVRKAVFNAEAGTSAEIVPVVAGASGRYDRAEDMVGLCVAMLALAATWLAFENVEPAHWGFGSGYYILAALIGASVAGFILGAVLATNLGGLRRIFTPEIQMRDEVNARARQVFFDARIHHTQGKSGLLLYVSLYERKAVVLGDHLVNEKLGQKALEELCAELTAELKKGNVTQALCTTVATTGKRLGAVMPREASDKNELADALIIID